MGHPFGEFEKNYVEAGPHRIGRIYKKVVYREYTDAKFNRLLTRSADEQYLGILGPVLYGEVGDTIKIFFKNNASRPFSMHPHGVLYQKNSEGSGYNDGTDGDDKADDAVQPGGHSGMRGAHCCSICSSICRGSRRPRSSAADNDRIGATSGMGGRYAGAVTLLLVWTEWSSTFSVPRNCTEFSHSSGAERSDEWNRRLKNPCSVSSKI